MPTQLSTSDQLQDFLTRLGQACSYPALRQKPEADARGVLSRLVKAGLAEARGARKGRSYHLSARVYRQLTEPQAYRMPNRLVHDGVLKPTGQRGRSVRY